MKTRSLSKVSVSSKTKNVSKKESNVVVINRTTRKSKANSSTNSKIEAAKSKEESRNKTVKNCANSDVEKNLQLEDISEETLKKLCLRLSTNDNFDFSGYEHEINFIDHVLKNTLENNDSNTVLICGPRGVGKSTLVDYCLNRYKIEDYSHQVIRLHGLLHNAESIFIRYVSTLLNIEATDFPKFVSSLKQFCDQRKVIFVLDSFDIFCRKHQTLLYNLFDISQKTGNICIIGITTRLDCIELLEKRVKSRMNHRILNVYSPFKSSEEYLKYAECLLDGKIKIVSSLKEILLQQYSMNTSITSLKHCLISFLLDSKKRGNKLDRTMDVKVNSICSLSYLNLSVLFLAFKYIESNNVQTFNCGSLVPLLSEIPTQISVSKKLLLKAVDELIKSGLIVKHASVRATSYLTEWTPLSLTIDEMHIKEVLTHKESILPLNVNRLLTTLQ